jgi:hypothetical protein
MNNVNKELEEGGYKGRKVDLLAHYAYCELKIRTREESRRFPSLFCGVLDETTIIDRVRC